MRFPMDMILAPRGLQFAQRKIDSHVSFSSSFYLTSLYFGYKESEQRERERVGVEDGNKKGNFETQINAGHSLKKN